MFAKTKLRGRRQIHQNTFQWILEGNHDETEQLATEGTDKTNTDDGGVVRKTQPILHGRLCQKTSLAM